MSSGRRLTGLVGEAGVGEECPVDHVGQASLQGADGLGGGVAVAAAAGQVALGVRVVAGLGDGDAVQRQVELSVAGTAETMALCVGRPHRQRGGAVVAGVGILGVEPPDVGGLAHELGRGEHPTAAKRQQRRRQATDPRHQVGFELVDLVELPRFRGHVGYAAGAGDGCWRS
jgi:hypothetical protein